ncbi:SCO family protein [Ideonella livida]|uniref:SCO family protein n=1 Tax=Ideonella livida TaxID=2707176 RepID=A0A7C9TK47_9BURK|nr:SCO family protein [Ideonella livida]NDY92559.1 SCO family protein [Ideonella livida]
MNASRHARARCERRRAATPSVGWRAHAWWLAGLLALVLGGARAGALPPGEGHTQFDPAIMKIDEARHLGQALQRDTVLLDEAGRPFTPGQLLGQPVVLVLSYYGCDGTCPVVNRNLAQVLAGVDRFRAGRDFQVLTVSFDDRDDPALAGRFRQALTAEVPGAGAGWRFAVLGDRSPEAVRAFAAQVGFNFFWSRTDRMFVHPNVLVFLTPEGRVARYLYGTRLEARTVELALIDADWGRISNSADAFFDMVTGACFSYSYADGRYQPNYALLAGVGSLLLGLGLMATGAIVYRRKLARRTVHAH